MAFYELCDDLGPVGMIVGGDLSDLEFRRAADAAGRPDERLITLSREEVHDPKLDRMAVDRYASIHVVGRYALRDAIENTTPNQSG
jgi:hypothetical protein